MYQLTKPDNVVEILEKSVAKFPQRPFLGTKNKTLQQYEWITYADFGKRVDNLRSGLSQIGVQKDDAVGIICNNSTDWAICFFANSGLGARFVPMYEAELVQVWKYIINAFSEIRIGYPVILFQLLIFCPKKRSLWKF